MFAGALALRASDIHIEPEETNIRLRYRLDGVLHDVIGMQRVIYERMISRLKLLSGMRLNVRDEAQDGRFSFTVGEQTIEVRASVIPGAAGESIVMRLLDPSVASFQFNNLGLNTILRAIMEEELARPNGLIITTGPTGSGKTTALYAFLQKVHTPDRKIITIEDPVEYKLDDIVQTQVAPDYSFAAGLRAILRQDPDVIMVGEIRDREVAETALHAAQTGHLVFTTLHTNSALGAFPRLIDLGVDYRTMGSAINIILGQRLVRVLCPHCKEAYPASTEEATILAQALTDHPAAPTLPAPLMLYRAVGCAACNHSGYKGRQGIYEAVRMDPAVEAAVLRDPREHVIAQAAAAQGIPTMVHDGIEKVLAGTTSLPELERVVDVRNLRLVERSQAPAENPTPGDEFAAHVVSL
jgi:type II secretory ATPase GspE/PulE/Tfp pilus assembly ATPase PilB-like protein